MKKSGWDLKKIKRTETYAEQNKACEADTETFFSCEPMQIKSYCKKQEDGRARHYEERSEKEDEIESWVRGNYPWGDIRETVEVHIIGCRTEKDECGLIYVDAASRVRCFVRSPVRVVTAGNRGNGSTTGGKRFVERKKTGGEQRVRGHKRRQSGRCTKWFCGRWRTNKFSHPHKTQRKEVHISLNRQQNTLNA